jgi:hypothetical protein
MCHVSFGATTKKLSIQHRKVPYRTKLKLKMKRSIFYEAC